MTAFGALRAELPRHVLAHVSTKRHLHAGLPTSEWTREGGRQAPNMPRDTVRRSNGVINMDISVSWCKEHSGRTHGVSFKAFLLASPTSTGSTGKAYRTVRLLVRANHSVVAVTIYCPVIDSDSHGVSEEHPYSPHPTSDRRHPQA